MKTCPRCHKQRPDDEVAHTCVAATTRPDHGAAQKWAAEMLRLDSVSPLWKTGNAAACYLDAMAQLDKAEKERAIAIHALEAMPRDERTGFMHPIVYYALVQVGAL